MRFHSFTRVALAIVTVACGHPAPSTGPEPMRGSVDGELSRDQRVRQALSRLTFGPRPGDFERVSSIGVERWIDQQLTPQAIPDSIANRVLGSLESQRKQVFELIADHPTPQEVQQRFNQRKLPGGAVQPRSAADSLLLLRAQQSSQRIVNEIMAAKLVRATTSERQLLEVMTDFWENHFSIFIGKMPTRYSVLEYDRDVIRPHALGKFRDLLGAVAKSPEMLVYLDNAQSGVDSLHPNVQEQRIEARRLASSSDPVVQALAILPHRRPRGLNENYGRELMELHTLGVDGGYSQADVQEVARALTGWTIDTPQFGGTFIFRPELHDAGEKVVLGHKLPAGRGIEDGEDVLDILARAPATARFITTKLARRFVSDDPPSALVDLCAATFTKTDGDIAQTMRCIVTSPEFFSRASYRVKVKSPFELVASMFRALGAASDTTPRGMQLVNQLGQPFFGRLTPDGWPERGDAWMNSGAIMNRINLGFRMASDQFPGVRLTNWPAAARLRPLSREAQVNGVIDEILGGDVSEDTRHALMSGESPVVQAAMSAKKPPVQPNSLAAIVGLALGSPEFQRR
jgi:uncharacterized protein (DUF1800 family)